MGWLVAGGSASGRSSCSRPVCFGSPELDAGDGRDSHQSECPGRDERRCDADRAEEAGGDGGRQPAAQ